MRGYQFFALTLLLTPPAFAHGGGLDASGCHNDRKRGGYHCHGAKQSAAMPLFSKAKRKTALSKVKRTAKRGFAKAQSLFGGNDDTVYFANCAAARAAGAAPVREGDAGYALRLDRDRDGVGCE